MYGLLGKVLKHSFSKEIHEYFTNQPYRLFEINDLKKFFSTNTFSGLNVTIPYKKDVIPYLDQLSSEAEALQSVNTIVNKQGSLIGYNTDYYGLEKALQYKGITVQGRDVIIVGNGSTSRTIQYYCAQKSAKNIVVLARNPKSNEHHFDRVSKFKNTTIIFNATPVGMFPNNNESFPINLDELPHLVSAIDMIYNPLRSPLLMEAKKRNIQAVNGLFMLISQAVKSIELFHNLIISDDDVIKYHRFLTQKMSNFFFIGMPMSGKTFFAKLVGKKYHKDVVDLDHVLEEENHMPITEIFAHFGESTFRSMEKSIVCKYSKQHNKAISCGGGVVLDKQNIYHLKQNGVLFFLDMPLYLLKTCNPRNRPLLQDKKNIERLYNERYDLYTKNADIIIPKTTYEKNLTMGIIEVKINEYFNS